MARARSFGVTGTDALDFKGGAFSPACGRPAKDDSADLDSLPSADAANYTPKSFRPVSTNLHLVYSKVQPLFPAHRL